MSQPWGDSLEFKVTLSRNPQFSLDLVKSRGFKDDTSQASSHGHGEHTGTITLNKGLALSLRPLWSVDIIVTILCPLHI